MSISDEQAARELLARVAARTVIYESLGVLQRWRGCDRAQALAWLRDGRNSAAQHVEAVRIVAVIDAGGDSRADPDATWD